jgi:hypothetical protein
MFALPGTVPLAQAVFPADQPDWMGMSVHGKAQALVREWLTLYVGEQNAGPLSRWPADRWAAAFNETGFFLALVMYTEAESGDWDVSFELPIFKPRPTTTDRQFRVASPKDSTRWSWTRHLDAARSIVASRRGIHGIWVCDDFDTIWCEIVQLMPHPRPGKPVEMFVETIGKPTAVRRLGV